MSAMHLSSADMERLLARPAAAEESGDFAEIHVRECAECAAEVAMMRGTLSAFRTSAAQAAEQQWVLAGRTQRANARRSGAPRMAWGLGAALACAAVVAVPVIHHERGQGSTGHVVQTAGAAKGSGQGGVDGSGAGISDDALLSGVQSDLSSSVPDPLLPLAASGAVDGAGSRQAQ